MIILKELLFQHGAVVENYSESEIIFSEGRIEILLSDTGRYCKNQKYF